MNKREAETAVAGALEAIRIEQGATQQQVADYLGIHRPALTAITTGRRGLSLWEAFRWAEAMGVDLGEICNRTIAGVYKPPRQRKKKRPVALHNGPGSKG